MDHWEYATDWCAVEITPDLDHVKVTCDDEVIFDGPVTNELQIKKVGQIEIEVPRKGRAVVCHVLIRHDGRPCDSLHVYRHTKPNMSPAWREVALVA